MDAKAGGQRDLINAAMQQAARVPSDSNSTIQTGDLQRVVGRLGVHVPDSIPGYTLLDEIHRGGQGVVFRARQDSTQRVVALKLMREGPFATQDEWVRFEREVRILAQLKHPNIVSIYHSDLTGDVFYYVMDYIDGEALDAWARRSERTLEELVRVFAQISQAVAAAHLRGVIHRDLKPSNIRVDREGVPHVLDFGLSKQVDEADDASSMTLTGQFVGSVPWASPEQAEGNAASLDIRTDVYSLGVLFYQTLVGRFPYDVSGSRHEVLRRVCEVEPKRPRSLRPSLPSDLETIVLKCLQKDPGRRYQSAVELARDIARYQANEPIEARRDSLSYLLVKQISRHRVPATIGALFLLLFVVGFFTSLAFWRQAVLAKEQESKQRWLAEQNATEAERQGSRAESEAAKAEATATFLEGILTTADPRSELGPDTTARELLGEAVRSLDDGSLADQPEVEERVRRTLARSFQGLGVFEEAKVQFERADRLLSNNMSVEVRVHALCEQAGLMEAMSDFQGALAHYEEALIVLEEQPELLEQDLAGRVLSGLGHSLRTLGRMEEAEEVLRRSLAIRARETGPVSEETIRSQTNLGLLLKDRAEFEESLELLRGVVTASRELYSDASPDLGTALNNYGDLLRQLNRTEEAIPILREALDVLRRSLPDDHPTVAIMLNNLGRAYQDLDRFEEAEPLFVEALRIARQVLGEEHATVAIMTNNLGLVHQEQGKLEEAAEAFAVALRQLRKVHGAEHPNTAMAGYNLARAYTKLDRYEDADELVSVSYDAFVATQGAGHPNTLRCGLLYGRVLVELEVYEAGVSLLRELKATGADRLDHDPGLRVAIEYGLGAALLRTGAFEEAETHLLQSQRDVADTPSADRMSEIVPSLVELYERWDRPEEAQRWRAEGERLGITFESDESE